MGSLSGVQISVMERCWFGSQPALHNQSVVDMAGCGWQGLDVTSCTSPPALVFDRRNPQLGVGCLLSSPKTLLASPRV